MRLRRSQLFVPGNDEKKIIKALGLKHCDSIIFDLEDAVPASAKTQARSLLKKVLTEKAAASGSSSPELCVRINPLSSSYALEDIAEFGDFDVISTIVVPKAETAGIRSLGKELANRKSLIPLIETARGFLNLEEIAKCEYVDALCFGAADFADSVGGKVNAYTKNIHVKTQLVIVARANDLEPIDSVFFGVSDLQGFREEALQSKELGFAGKQVIHPTQIEIANEVFSPSKEELEWSRKIVAAYERAEALSVGAIRMDDQLVDAVHYRMAKDMLEKLRNIESR